MQKGKDMILVSGATGKQGGATARALLDAGHKVRAMTRHPEGDAAKALAAAGAEVVQADLNDEASLKAALDGAWGAFAVQDTWTAGVELEEEQGKRFARLAKDAGVQHYVYASVASADRETGIPHFENKFRVEQLVRELGFPSWTIIRPVFFMTNFLLPDSRAALANGTLAFALPPGTPLQMIDPNDIGAHGKRAFEEHEALNGAAFDIAGDELNLVDAAAILSGAMGKPVTFQSVPVEQIRAFSEDYALMVEWFEAVGYDADIAGMAKESGIRPTTFTEWVKKADLPR